MYGYSQLYGCHRIPLPSTSCIADIRYAWSVRQKMGVHNTSYIRRLLKELRTWREINKTKRLMISW